MAAQHPGSRQAPLRAVDLTVLTVSVDSAKIRKFLRSTRGLDLKRILLYIICFVGVGFLCCMIKFEPTDSSPLADLRIFLISANASKW